MSIGIAIYIYMLLINIVFFKTTISAVAILKKNCQPLVIEEG